MDGIGGNSQPLTSNDPDPLIDDDPLVDGDPLVDDELDVGDTDVAGGVSSNNGVTMQDVDNDGDVDGADIVQEDVEVPDLPFPGFKWSKDELLEMAQQLSAQLQEDLEIEGFIMSMFFALIIETGELEAKTIEQGAKISESMASMVGPISELTKEIELKSAEAEKMQAIGQIASGALEVAGAGAQIAATAYGAAKSKKKVDLEVKKTGGTSKATSSKTAKTDGGAGGEAPKIKSGKKTSDADVEASTPEAKAKQRKKELKKERKRKKEEAKIEKGPGKGQRFADWINEHKHTVLPVIPQLTRGIGGIVQGAMGIKAAELKREVAFDKATQTALQMTNDLLNTASQKIGSLGQKAGDWKSSLVNNIMSYIQSTSSSTKSMFGG